MGGEVFHASPFYSEDNNHFKNYVKVEDFASFLPTDVYKIRDVTSIEDAPQNEVLVIFVCFARLHFEFYITVVETCGVL